MDQPRTISTMQFVAQRGESEGSYRQASRQIGDEEAGEMSTDNKVKLRSSDNEIFYVNEKIANQWGTLKILIENIGTDSVIPIPDVKSKILAKVIEYCEYHLESKMNFDDQSPIPECKVKQCDAKFIMVDEDNLFSLVTAADYLKIKNLTCQALADRIKVMTTEEIREKFNIVNDLTPEKEAEFTRQNTWAFE